MFARAVIFGAGAVGTYLGVRLAAVLPLTLVVRPEAERTIRRRGLQVHGQFEARIGPGAITVTTRAPSLPPASLVVVAVKLPDLHQAGRDLAAVARDDTTFLLLQNGLVGRELFLAGAGRPLATQRAVASLGAELLGPGRVVFTGGGLSLEPSPVAGPLLELFAKAGIEAAASPDFERALWKKLAVNCVANPLTALLGVRNCEVVTPELEAVRWGAVAEVAALAARHGHPLPDDLPARIDASLKMSTNRSSMLQDLARGRPTEIEFLNGYVARRAAELGLEAPINATLAALLRARQKLARGARPAARRRP